MARTPVPDIPDCSGITLVGDRVARTIYSAHHDQLGRPVTITVYPPFADPADRDHFDAAAAVAHRLGAHPNILAVHAWGVTADGAPWVVTDAEVTASAAELLSERGPLDIAQALRIGILLAGAVESAHRAGVVHGDISPAEMVFGAGGEPLLGETGLTQFARLTALQSLMAPIRYHAPPEVLEGGAATPTSDVYSLASTVYALVVGRAPQEKPANVTDSNASLLLRVLQIGVPQIERPGLPPGLDDVLRAAMAPQAGHRPQQAIELAWALHDVQRRAGLAATEPVVLDPAELDRMARGPQGVRSTTDGPSLVGAPAGMPPVPDLWGGNGRAQDGPVPAVDDAPIFPGLVDSPGPAPHEVDSPGGAGAPAGVPGPAPAAAPTPDLDAGARPPTVAADGAYSRGTVGTPGPPAPPRPGPDPDAARPPLPEREPQAGAGAEAPAPLWEWSAPTDDGPPSPTATPAPADPGDDPPGGAGGPPDDLPAWFTDPLPSEVARDDGAATSSPHAPAPGGDGAPFVTGAPVGPAPGRPEAPVWADPTAGPGSPPAGPSTWPDQPSRDAGWLVGPGGSPGAPTGPAPAAPPVGGDQAPPQGSAWIPGVQPADPPPSSTPGRPPGTPPESPPNWSWPPAPATNGPAPATPRATPDAPQLPARLETTPPATAPPDGHRPALPQRQPSPGPRPAPTPGPPARSPAQPHREAADSAPTAPGRPAAGQRRSDEAYPTDADAGGLPFAATGVIGMGRPGSALERARQARAERQRAEAAAGARPALPAGSGNGSRRSADGRGAATALPAGPARSGDADAAPATKPEVRGSSIPALPLVVLVVVVLVLAIGAAWVIIKGEEPPPPSSGTGEPAPQSIVVEPAEQSGG